MKEYLNIIKHSAKGKIVIEELIEFDKQNAKEKIEQLQKQIEDLEWKLTKIKGQEYIELLYTIAEKKQEVENIKCEYRIE